ncbi:PHOSPHOLIPASE D [Encephalitozoon cuniculi GB-M1]|uniref:Phospholipase n=1 Tax=Encephalitozoon cuniculi (strain GB-M1) TaxID=284813 RepID=Q8SQV3_ENCCU|nr:phospholipase D [Encephalitozoon cuniculi GB-M1]CAD26028.1 PHOSPHOLIPASE D [Encephalitozoon cuniculi GB-M1]
MEIPDKASADGMPQGLMHTSGEDTSLALRRGHTYASLLGSVLMVPFRRLGFLSRESVFPVLLDQVKASVDGASSSPTSYVVNLSYGRQRWRINVGIVQLFSLNAYLHYREVMDSRRDKPDICTEEQCSSIEEFLRAVLHRSRYLDIGKVYDFFRISRHSFSGTKMFEDKFHVDITDLDGGRCAGSCYRVSRSSGKMYVVCKKSHLVLVDYKNGHEDADVLFYGGDLNVKYKMNVFYSKVVIDKGGKRYTIKSFRHEAVRRLFGEILEGEERIRGSSRLTSFSPVRRGNVVNFYVDGKSYFWNLYDTLCLARREVFIAGWWIYPTLYLRVKPVGKGLDKRYRLDHVLKELAEKGVKIRILVYKEVLRALNIDSNYTYEFLSKLHRRIEVLRHPNGMGRIPIYWTHHEKVVVVDQRIAYVGGIDLGLGRYDTQEHPLVSKEHQAGYLEAYEKEENGLEPSDLPRMPWHDVQCKVVGSSAFDISRHFIERWNFIVSEDGGGKRTELLVPNEELGAIDSMSSDSLEDGGLVRTQVLRSVGRWSLGIDEDSVSRGYSEVIRGSRRFIYIENQFFITRCSSAPGYPENTVGRVLAERIIEADRAGEEFKVYVVIPLFPALDAGLMVSPTPAVEIIRIQEQSISKGEKSLYQVLRGHGVDPDKYLVFMSLRKVHFDGKRVAQEQIYVHSKVIIADGTSAIVGSTNLNDRSMVGCRDTEIALLVEDDNEVVHKLLRTLLEEHLGVKRGAERSRCGPLDFLEHHLLGSTLDLGSNDVFNRIVDRARTNTEMFKRLLELDGGYGGRRLCPCPVDSVLVQNLLHGIQGHLVLFTDDLLVGRESEKSIFSIHGFIPSVVYY